MNISNAVNPNVFLAQIFVNELIEQGVETVCISPGSRSTPLVMAFAERSSEVEIKVIIDERGAGFFAVGAAKMTKKPTVLVCTSGTALANYFPAILEAHRNKVPLLVLSADRPHKLRDSGANQTLDQIKIFGEHVKWFVDMIPPAKEVDISFIKFIRTTAARAYNACLSNPCGAVHINFPFQKPLEPSGVLIPLPQILRKLGIPPVALSSQNFTKGELHLDGHYFDEVVELMKRKRRGVIIAGPISNMDQELFAAINLMADMVGYPILADPLSNLRFNLEQKNLVVTGYESFFQSSDIRELCGVEVIFQIGDTPTSKYLLTYLDENQSAIRITLQENDGWVDESLSTNYYFNVAPSKALPQLVERFDEKISPRPLLNLLQKLERFHVRKIKEFIKREKTDATVIANIVQSLPSEATLVVANSLPVRHLDQFCPVISKNIKVFGNRGLSGIDGLIATAAGIASLSSSSVNVLLIGDIAFLHDFNSLLLVAQHRPNLTIVLLNNSGGGIFHRLPIRTHEEVFDKYFLTPHSVDFSAVSNLFGIRVETMENLKQLKRTFLKEQLTREPVILEFKTNSQIDEETRVQFMEQYLLDLRVKFKRRP